MKHYLTAIAILPSALLAAPISITGAGSMTQNFSTLPTTGSTTWTDDSSISAWYAQRSGTGTSIAADTGSGTSGNLYSYGTTSDADRALGSLGSGNGAAGSFAWGVLLKNDSAASAIIDSISYTGEQWRKSGVTVAQPITLWYKKDSSAITALTPASNGGWIAITAGDFASPINTSGPGSLDGNNSANRTVIAAFNPNISLAAGEFVMIRWSDPDHSGSDHGLAIDDVNIGWSASTTPALTLSAAPNTFAENAGAAASTGTVEIPTALGTDLTVNLSSNDTTEATVPASVVILAGNTSATFSIEAIDDLLADATQTVTFTATAAGYLDGTTQATVSNDTDAAIAVTATATSFVENATAPASVGTVTVAAPVTVDTTISLSSSDLTECTVPASVIITTGNTTADFDITAVPDGIVDGNIGVFINASATGYTGGSIPLTINNVDAPPTPELTTGSIAFTGISAEGGDALSFVALTNINAGQIIFFTDNNWNGSSIGSGGAFAVSEGNVSWTCPAGGITAGTVVYISGLENTPSASVGSVIRIGSINLAAGGDVVLAYQGLTNNPSVFLAGIATSTENFAGTSLTAGTHALNLGLGTDIAAFNGARNNKHIFSAYLTSINDVANWVSQDAGGDQSNDTIAPDMPFDTTVFTLSSGTPFQNWITGAPYNLSGADAAFSADPDNDSVPNGIEFIVGGNPTVANDASEYLPNTFISGTPPSRTATIEYRLKASAAYLNPTLQMSENLQAWATVQDGQSGAVVAITNNFYATGWHKVTVFLPANGDKGFVRLRASE